MKGGVSKYNLAWQEARLKEDQVKLEKMISRVQKFDNKVRERRNWIKLLKDNRNGLLE